MSLSAPALLFVPPTSGVAIGAGVTFQPSDSWSNISFSSAQTFTAIHLDPTGVSFDSVRFGVVKSPTSLPRSSIVITMWEPLQTNANATALEFSGDAPTGSSLAFALSHLIPAHEYVLQVDGTEASRALSNQTGFVAFAWSAFTPHDFRIVVGWRTGLPLPPPSLSAGFAYAPMNPGAGQPVTFAAAAAGGFAPYGYGWQFGDGATSSGVGPSHAYSNGGNYTVVLTVTDLSGATTSASSIVAVQQVAPPPALVVSLVFTPGQPHAMDPVAFACAVSGGPPPYTYSWTFGDSASASTASVVHAFVAAGSYFVNLTVVDAASATARATTRVNVTGARLAPRGNVTAAFDFTVDGATVTFTDRSASDVGLPIVTWFWAFGDGTSSTEAGPVHSYALPGIAVSYTVVLAVCDSGGHCGSTSRVVTLINWTVVILLLALAAAVVAVLVVLVRRRRRKRKRLERAASMRAPRPPPD